MFNSRNRQKRAAGLPRLYLPLLILIILGYCLTSLSAGTDFWAHAAVGRWIIEHHQIPRQTLFLWSANVPWIWHSWLSQVIFYELLAHVPLAVGAVLAMLLTAVAACVSLLVWWKVWLQHQQQMGAGNAPGLLMPLIFLLAIFTSHGRFYPRPEIFTAVFITVLLWILIRRITSWRQLAAIFVIFALWANLHAGLAAGLAILAVSFLCNLAQDKSWRGARWDLMAVAAAVCGVFVNPYGWHYWAALKPISSITFSFITEWRPFWKSPPLHTTTIVAVFACFFCAFFAWLFSKQRRYAHLGWLIGSLILFLMARRNLWILAQISLAVIACNPRLFLTQTLWDFWTCRRQLVNKIISAPLQRWVRVGLFSYLIIAFLATLSPDFWQGRPVNPDAPVRAARILRKIAPGRRIFNGYEISSYLEWQLSGKPSLFIDLLNAYPSRIMEDYMKMIDGGGVSRKLLKKWHISYIILPQIEDDSPPSGLFLWLNMQPQWQIIYYGDDAVIWKKNPSAKPNSLFLLQ
jgi:hypothetical protein